MKGFVVFEWCPSKRGISSLCCSHAFSACWIGEVSTQYPIQIVYIAFNCCMSLGFIDRGYGLAAPCSRLSRAILLALLAGLV